MSLNTMGLFELRLLRNESLSSTCCILVFERPEGFPDALPGQFVSVRVAESTDPLLRRPYSIMDLTVDSLSLLVKVVGRGSAILAGKLPGDAVNIIGPLGGTSFSGPESGSAVLAAGGTGLAPIVFAARTWSRGGTSPEMHLLYGAESGSELLTGLVKEDFTECRFATLDGSTGYHGDVVSLCDDLLEKGLIPTGCLYSCGPRGMVRALVQRVGGRFTEHLTSLETVMACGVGACRGCTVPVRESGGLVFKSVCSDGTVFRAGDIAWEEWEG